MSDRQTDRAALPHVTVLMATCNGARWLDEQIDSVLAQDGVSVDLVVSDDASTDGTRELLERRASADERIHLLPQRAGDAGSAANFLHLLRTVTPPVGAYVAMSDQDDVWEADKLALEVGILESTGAAAVSSNVRSFDVVGNSHVVRKDWPQRRWDFVFEAGGPGSTYVFSPLTAQDLREWCRELDAAPLGNTMPGLAGLWAHDWLMYALVRASGGMWVIAHTPTVRYRQHDGNAQGERSGVAAIRTRVLRLHSGFYREQFLLTARAARVVGAPRRDARWLADLDALIADLEGGSWGARWRIAKRFRDIRRRTVEGAALALACLLGMW